MYCKFYTECKNGYQCPLAYTPEAKLKLGNVSLYEERPVCFLKPYNIDDYVEIPIRKGMRNE